MKEERPPVAVRPPAREPEVDGNGSHGMPVRPYAPARPPRRGRILFLLILLCAVGAAAYLMLGVPAGKKGETPTSGAAPGPAGGGRVTPVVAAPATTGDIGVYLTGLGSVTPLYTVTVKSRVDGQLMRVHFDEGQL